MVPAGGGGFFFLPTTLGRTVGGLTATAGVGVNLGLPAADGGGGFGFGLPAAAGSDGFEGTRAGLGPGAAAMKRGVVGANQREAGMHL